MLRAFLIQAVRLDHSCVPRQEGWFGTANQGRRLGEWVAVGAGAEAAERPLTAGGGSDHSALEHGGDSRPIFGGNTYPDQGLHREAAPWTSCLQSTLSIVRRVSIVTTSYWFVAAVSTGFRWSAGVQPYDSAQLTRCTYRLVFGCPQSIAHAFRLRPWLRRASRLPPVSIARRADPIASVPRSWRFNRHARQSFRRRHWKVERFRSSAVPQSPEQTQERASQVSHSCHRCHFHVYGGSPPEEHREIHDPERTHCTQRATRSMVWYH